MTSVVRPANSSQVLSPFGWQAKKPREFWSTFRAQGALFRFDPALAIGAEAVGQTVVFTSWYDVGALIRPRGTAVRFFEAPDGNHLAVRYLPD